VLALSIALVSVTLVSTSLAQTTSTSVTKGASSSATEVRRGEVVYVSGQELVVKMEDGQIKHFTVPVGAHYTVDGKSYTIRDLKPGMHLTQRITTTTTPQTITTVRSVSGKVWHVNPPSMVILTLPDGTNKQFKVPKGVKFTIEGEEKTVFDLRKGMQVTATAVKQEPETVVSKQTAVTGRPGAPAPAPAPAAAPPPEMPPAAQVGALLVETDTPAKPAPTAAAQASAEPAPKKLPKTASQMPLLGLLGALAVLTAVGLSVTRRIRSH
jgi:LPXTG-motif cell wall-anchored protein